MSRGQFAFTSALKKTPSGGAGVVTSDVHASERQLKLKRKSSTGFKLSSSECRDGDTGVQVTTLLNIVVNLLQFMLTHLHPVSSAFTTPGVNSARRDPVWLQLYRHCSYHMPGVPADCSGT